MKRAYEKSQYAKPCEQYCREVYPHEAKAIFQKAEEYYLAFLKDMPDLGKNMMAKNMLDMYIKKMVRIHKMRMKQFDQQTLHIHLNPLNLI